MQLSCIKHEEFGQLSFYFGGELMTIIVHREDQIELTVDNQSIITLDGITEMSEFLANNYNFDDDDRIVITNILMRILDTVRSNWDRISKENKEEVDPEELIKNLSTNCGQNVDNSPDELNAENRRYWIKNIQHEVVGELSDQLVEALKDVVDWDNIKQNLINLCKDDVDGLAKTLAPQVEKKVAEKLYNEIGSDICTDMTDGTPIDDIANEIKEDYIIGGR